MKYINQLNSQKYTTILQNNLNQSRSRIFDTQLTWSQIPVQRIFKFFQGNNRFSRAHSPPLPGFNMSG